MIPKVNKKEFTADLVEDEAVYRARPEWFKFFYAAWYLSTASMDDKQCGWYIRMLTWAATEGEPPGYLPNDEDELKQIARMTALPADITYLLGLGVVIPQMAITQIIGERERKWQKVRRKFVTSDDGDSVYNPRLIKALKQAYRFREVAAQAGKEGATARWGKSKKPKEKIASAIPEAIAHEEEKETEGQMPSPEELMAYPNGSANAYKISLLSLPITEDTSESGEGIGLSLIEVEETTRGEGVLELGDTEKEVAGLTNSEQGESPRFPEKKKRRPETFFEISRWKITPKMTAFLLTKYSAGGIEVGDIDYLGEKFATVHHNSKYSNWRMAFYNFVDNQIVKYGYTFGMYKRRGRNEQKSTAAGGLRPGVKPWEADTEGGRVSDDESPRRHQQFESAADRNARLERESDEAVRRLRGGGSGTHSKDSTGLSLTADDLG